MLRISAQILTQLWPKTDRLHLQLTAELRDTGVTHMVLVFENIKDAVFRVSWREAGGWHCLSEESLWKL